MKTAKEWQKELANHGELASIESIKQIQVDAILCVCERFVMRTAPMLEPALRDLLQELKK